MKAGGFPNGFKGAAALAVSIALGLALLVAGCGSGAPSSSASSQGSSAQAPSEAQAQLSSWADGSQSLKALTDFVEAATDEANPGYIPPEDRVAVFDLDGTLMCETYPWCFEYMVFADYALNNPDYEAPDDVKAVAREIVDSAWGAKPDGMSTRQAAAAAVAYKGLTPAELEAYVTKFKDSPAGGFSGMSRGEAWYRPMTEVVSYLRENGFDVYIVTATERNIVRGIVAGSLDVDPSHVIGTEYGYTATGQGDAADADYTFQMGDQVVFDGTYAGENAKTSKVDAIVREIGKQPVLAFGNSSGDVAMLTYVLSGNAHPSAAFMVLADDAEREYGDADAAAEKRANWEKSGFTVFSMRDDFATIYGEGVEKNPTGSTAKAAAADVPVMAEDNARSILFDTTIDGFNEKGFDYGDSVDIAFSNGYKLENIPYYNGYYAEVGKQLLVGYPGSPCIKAATNYYDGLWDEAGLAEGDTATITLREKGAYLDVQEAFDITYSNDRADFGSDEQFANFRAMPGGSVKQGAVYRSASPIYNKYNRSAYVEKLMEQAGVRFVLDLSDNPDEAAAFAQESKAAGVDVSYFEALRDEGCVAMIDLTAGYPSDAFKQRIAAGLAEMSQHEGPYLVHCVEGKDRTGFVCMLLQALCGAGYDEMLADYMETYENYYGMTEQDDPASYEAISDLNFNGMLRYLAGVDEEADLSAIDYAGPARDYLLEGGMTDEQIDALVARLTA